MTLKNEALQKIADTYKNKSNKDLSNVLMNLHNDFTQMKTAMLQLAETVSEIEQVYDKVFAELQSRLKFETPKQDADANGN